MKKLILIFIASIITQIGNSQDTYSIVAIDTITGEVGSAGASCVDLIYYNETDVGFLSELFPNLGAINTQAYWLLENQNNAANRMMMGEMPSQIIDWLVDNDAEGNSDKRQYGIVAMVNGSPQAAAYTGSDVQTWEGAWNEIIGPNYSIQGNVILKEEVLDSMEARFLNEPGNLAQKLMASLQGANMPGADIRCLPNGTSSLFAFVKVAQPTDQHKSPSFYVSVRTQENSGIEPIDSLQTIFDLEHNIVLGLKETKDFDKFFSVYPNPSFYEINIHNNTNEVYDLFLLDTYGRLVYKELINKTKTIDVQKFKGGIYYLKISNGKRTFFKKLIIQNGMGG